MIYNKTYFRSSENFTCDTTPKRIVKHFELEIYDNGTGFASIDNVLYPHNDNMIIFAKPNQERFTIGSFNCYTIHFSCVDEEIVKILNSVPDCTVVDQNTKAQLIGYFKSTDLESNLQTLTSILNILNTVKNSNQFSKQKTQAIPKRIIQVKEYIDNNYKNEIELSKLKEIADLSINYIRKQFSECYGITIQKYITELRLSYIKKLLVSTDMSMCDIAYESGFNSQSHMNYIFKEHFGISPLKYKTLFYGNNGNFAK